MTHVTVGVNCRTCHKKNYSDHGPQETAWCGCRMHSITALSAPLRQNCREDTKPDQVAEAFGAGGPRTNGETHSAQGNTVCRVPT